MSYNDKMDFCTLPSTVGGNTTTRFGDYYYRNPNTTAITSFLLGGGWNYGSLAGFAYWYVTHASTSRDRYIGGRVVCLRS